MVASSRRRPIILAALVALTLALFAQPAGATTPAFTHAVLGNFTITNPTSLAFGPDGRLYVASQTEIWALTLNAGGTSVVASEQIATGQDEITGIAFDPTAPASPVVVYASRRNAAATDSYEGVVSRFTGPTWTRTDVITGLPNSTPYTNHYTNGLAFDSSGVLYIAQGSNTDAGLQTPNFPETPLSAAILVADISDPGFNGTITYNPPGVPADDFVDQNGGTVSVYAPGTRNPYDLVVHSNGYIYATDNGPNGPNTSATCSTSTSSGVSQNDELNRIVSGNYYGFPNRNRGRTNSRQCTYHAPAEGNGADFTAPIATLPAHCSCDGITEYTSSVFGPAMQGDLVFAELTTGEVSRADLSSNGLSVNSITTLASGLNFPLDVTMGAGGRIYVAEYGGNQVSYLAPLGKPVGGVTELPGIGVTATHTTHFVIGGALTLLTGVAVVGAAFAARRRGNDT